VFIYNLSYNNYPVNLGTLQRYITMIIIVQYTQKRIIIFVQK